MKIKILRLLVTARQWANSENGERKLMIGFQVLITVWLLDVALLLIGSLL